MIKLKVWSEILPVWMNTQVEMQEIIRWGRYTKTGVRAQNNLQHTFGIGILGSILLAYMGRESFDIDQGLVYEALQFHDVSEGILKRDVHGPSKTSQDDLAEYLAFKERFSVLPDVIYERLKVAFLLQFVLDDYSWLPEEERAVVDAMKEAYLMEAKIFRVLELWDYVMYGYEQYIYRGKPDILMSVLETRYRELVILASQVPVFLEYIWTQEVQEYFIKFSQEHGVDLK